MRDLYKVYLKSRSIDEEKLTKFGFRKDNEKYTYKKEIKYNEKLISGVQILENNIVFLFH